jgi:ATP-dependent helicase Lhr and Lhr-like helicase
MDEPSQTDSLLRVHKNLRRQMTHTWNAFFGNFSQLRPVQLAALPPILNRRNVLITAPTAGGKTEAAVAPLCERMKREKWLGMSILLITPTRALVNDLYGRLQIPCDRANILLGRKTADHGISDDFKCQILVTTPESTESLLTFRKACLFQVRAVILDEIHLLDGTARGDQLRLLLNRLSLFLQGGQPRSDFAALQRIAMSATVSDPKRLAETYLGADAEAIIVPGQRPLDAKIVCVPGEDRERARLAIAAIDQFPDVRKVLVFVNSRKQVDAGTSHFKYGRFAKLRVYGHHGSLSKNERETIETRFKSDSQAVCVATMTLEVGIDIGDIDLVICLDPPFSLASFLQRIGRGCRRLKGGTRVLCVARDRRGELMFEALIRQASLGMPPGPVTPVRRSVLVQQTLAYLQQVDGNLRVQDQIVRALGSDARPPVRSECIKEMLDDMHKNGLIDKRGEVFQPASKGREFIESERIFSNIPPAPLEISLMDVDTGKVVATVADIGRDKGVQIAGKSYDVLPGGTGNVRRVRGGAKVGETPRYHARRLPYAHDVGCALAGLLGIPPDTLVVIDRSGELILMTWLGQLLNEALSVGLINRGVQARAGAFCLRISPNLPLDPLAELRDVVRDVVQTNPLGAMNVERMTDLGAHFELLSSPLQQKAREEFLPVEFLERWINGICEARRVPAESDLGNNLIALME